MKMPCGVHKDKEIEELPSDYIEWVAKTWEEKDPRNKALCEAADQEFQFRTKYNSHF